MIKIIANIIATPIFPKQRRHRIKKYLYSVNIVEFISTPWRLIKIILTANIRNAYCLIEINPFHIECMWAIYDTIKNKSDVISLFTTKENIEKQIFPRQIKIHKITPYDVKILDILHIFNKSNMIFMGSYFVPSTRKTANFYLQNFLKTGKPMLALDHAPTFYNFRAPLPNNIHRFVLADFMGVQYNMPVFYTCTYPEQSTMNKQDKSFISVGVIGDQSRRDMDSYIKWITKNPDVHSDIICSIIFPGWHKRLNKLKNISVHERASFTQLFESCKKATFIPFLIHGDDLGYYNQAISGNLNLALGFTIIPIIDARLARLYGFDEKHAIIYKGQKEFEGAMTRAANMTDNEIKSKQEALKQMYTEYLIKSQLEIDKFL